MNAAPRVAIDATALPADRGGVGRYLEGLLGALPADLDLVVVAQPGDVAALRDLAPAAQIVAAPRFARRRPLRLIWEQLGLPALLRRHDRNVLHSPHYTFPLTSRAARVMTLHDATFFSEPAWHGTLKGPFFRFWCRRAWRGAGVIVVPSAATAGEFARFLGPRRGPVVVAHHGVDTARFHPVEPAAVAAFAGRHDLDPGRGWIAFLGTIEPRKNVPALVDAHRLLLADHPGGPVLALSGKRGWDDRAAEILDAHVDDSEVRELGYLPLDDLAAFLAGATVVAYPSSGEGFGLPVLEAMACGATVLTTTRLALPEVGGDVPLYTEPDAHSLASALAAVLADPADAARRGRLGIERAATFSWQRCAAVHLGAYERATR